MTSKIEWTDETWNPVTGCSPISAGCNNCYAAREASGRLRGLPAYEGLAVNGRFTGEVRLHPDRLDLPLRWRRPRRVFVNSMSDLFHHGVPSEFIGRVWQTMLGCPQHTFQVLTKRPRMMRRWVTGCREPADPVGSGWITHDGTMFGGQDETDRGVIVGDRGRWPLPNVWLGTSVEDHASARRRIPELLATPAAVRFLSVEPLLGPVDLSEWLTRPCPDCAGTGSVPVAGGGKTCSRCYPDPSVPPDRQPPQGVVRNGIGWVIVGGESGPDARPMRPTWARLVRDQCVAAGVPFLFKQWGEWAPYPAEGWREMRRVGRKAAGRELDGRTWDQYPEVPDA